MEVGKNEIAINPFDTSDMISVSYSGYSLMQPIISVAVTNYSDSLKSYENNVEQGISESELEENKTNFITLEIDTPPRYENDIFRLDLSN